MGCTGNGRVTDLKISYWSLVFILYTERAGAKGEGTPGLLLCFPIVLICFFLLFLLLLLLGLPWGERRLFVIVHVPA